jgi:poly(3-hydroxybutyrate) depolymerase
MQTAGLCSGPASKNSPSVNRTLSLVTVGSGNFEWTDARGNSDKPIKVFFHRPQNWKVNGPIVIVMHGVKRDADRYCQQWTGAADKGNFLIVCPQFLEQEYPTAAYQWGNMFDSNKQPIPREKWTFTAVEHLFDQIKSITGSTNQQYYLFGHSAGGQFVHRFVMFMPDARYKRAIAANPGFYTMPVYNEHQYPFGLRNSDLSQSDLKKSFSRDFVLMLGEEDIDPTDPELNKSRRAEDEGSNRFERGQNFFKTARSAANQLGVDLHWRLRTVPNAHHSDAQMGVAAAPVFFE